MKQREWLFGNIVIVDFQKIDSCYRLPISIMDEYLLKIPFKKNILFHLSFFIVRNTKFAFMIQNVYIDKHKFNLCHL